MPQATVERSNNSHGLKSSASLSKTKARRRVNEVKANMASTYERLLALHEDGVHTALGYSSWAGFCEASMPRLISGTLSLISGTPSRGQPNRKEWAEFGALPDEAKQARRLADQIEWIGASIRKLAESDSAPILATLDQTEIEALRERVDRQAELLRDVHRRLGGESR